MNDVLGNGDGPVERLMDASDTLFSRRRFGTEE
jgi:hypothetical protein